MYASHTLVGQEYTEEILILQINLTYGMGIEENKILVMLELETGIKQGTHQGKISIAKNLLKRNVDIDIISERTVLSKEQINNL